MSGVETPDRLKISGSRAFTDLVKCAGMIALEPALVPIYIPSKDEITWITNPGLWL